MADTFTVPPAFDPTIKEAIENHEKRNCRRKIIMICTIVASVVVPIVAVVLVSNKTEPTPEVTVTPEEL